MIPIDFILNFQVNSGKATQGIGKLSDSTEKLAKSFEEVTNNFQGWYGKVIDVVKLENKNIRSVGDALLKTFNSELVKKFHGNLSKVSEEFQNMYRDRGFKQVQASFDSMSAAMEHFAPHIKMSDDQMQKLLSSLADVRIKEGEKGILKFDEAFKKMAKNIDKMDEKTMAEMTKLLDKFAKSKQSLKNLKEFQKGLEGVNKAVDAIIQKEKDLDKLKETFSTVFGFSPTLESLIRQIARAAGAFTAFSDAAEAQTDIVKTMTSMGMVSQNISKNMFAMVEPLNDYTRAVLSAGAQTSTSMKEAAQAMGELAAIRVTDNIQDLGELSVTTIRMSQAFGMSTSEAAEFAKSLVRIGGLTKKDFADAGNEFANIQSQLGLTSQEASSAAGQIGSMARTMKAFGGRINDVKSLTAGVAKLTVAFTRAGLSADQANDILTGMLDPSRIEENILLYQGLGMSAGDAIGLMSGDTKNLNNMNEKMVNLAKQLKAQYGGNVFALQEMAKQYGLSLEQVQSLSQLNAKDLKVSQEKADLEEQANKARASMASSGKMLANQLNIIIQTFVMPLLNFLTPIVGFLARTLQWIQKIIEQAKAGNKVLKVLFNIFGFVFGAATLFFLLGIAGVITRNLIPGLKSVGGLLGGIKNGLGGIITKAKDAVASLLKLDKIGGGGKKAPAKRVRDAKGRFAKAGPEDALKQQKSGFLEQLSKVKPAQLLALGAAIFFIAAGIALIVASVALLAQSIKELNPEQLAKLIQLMMVIMGAVIIIIAIFCIAIIALGAAGSAAAVGILAIGVAFLLMGAGIALIIFSIAYLIKTVSESKDGIAALGAVVAQLIPIFVALTLGIMGLGAALIMLGSFAAAGLAGLVVLSGMVLMMLIMLPIVLKLGEGFSLMGLGIKNIAEFGASAAQSLIALRDTMKTIGGSFADDFVKQINSIAEAMGKISTGSMLMNTVMKIIASPADKQDSSANTTAGANTQVVSELIAEGNSYLSVIMENTNKIVKILSTEKTTKAIATSSRIQSRPLVPKEG